MVKIFIDSDVVISSLLSEKGAAFFLLNQTKGVKLYISNYSKKELLEVTKRLKLGDVKLKILIQKLKIVRLNEIEKYKGFVFDKKDGHIVAGTKESQANFLISYNLRHFKIDQIRDELDIIIMTPATFLQYLRSRSNNP